MGNKNNLVKRLCFSTHYTYFFHISSRIIFPLTYLQRVFFPRIKENLSARYMQGTYRVSKGVRKRVAIGGENKKADIKIVTAQ
jgi:hypothetical protein